MFIGLDVVRLGPCDVTSPFAIIKVSDEHDVQNCNGILGLGYSDRTGSLSFLRTLMSSARPSWHVEQGEDAVLMSNRKFAFLANDKAGELQLGGYDESSVADPVFFTPMLNSSGYAAHVLSLRYNGVELLRSSSSDQRYVIIPDTSASCIMLPSVSPTGSSPSVYSSFLAEYDSNPSGEFEFTVGGLTMQEGGGSGLNEYMQNTTYKFLIPPSKWKPPSGCVEASKSASRIVFGDPIFRSLIVVFDLEGPVYKLGFAAIRHGYSIGKAPMNPWKSRNREFHKITALRHRVRRGSPQSLSRGNFTSSDARSTLSSPGSDLGGDHEVRYLLHLGVGTPMQTVRVILDTSTSLLSLFSKSWSLDQGSNGLYDAFNELKVGTSAKWAWVGLGFLGVILVAVFLPICARRIKRSPANQSATGKKYYTAPVCPGSGMWA